VARRLRTRIGVDADPDARRALRGVLGGAVAHMCLRMLAIDEATRAAMAAGIDQVVLLGAGLDTRAWRLAELAGARVLELDLPETQEAKRLRLAGVPLQAREIRFVPVDLHRADLDWILGDVGHDASRPTLWVWEAVAMYVPLPSVHATLEVLGGRSAAGSHLAMTFAVPEGLGPGRVGRALGPAARALFDLLGEPMRTLLHEEEVTALVRAAGFTEIEVSDSAAWAETAGTEVPRDPLGAERLTVARFPTGG
jgi:methyltransferase (TIGR00027 family)